MSFNSRIPLAASVALGVACLCSTSVVGSEKQDGETPDPTQQAVAEIGEMDVGQHDWPQWLGWTHRNNTPHAENLPTEWNVGEVDPQSGERTGMENIKWVTELGSQTYGNPVVANGHVYVGTNNGAGYIERYPSSVDLGCLICFDEQTGEFLWQHSNEKLPTGRVNDWPLQGVCDAPYVDGQRLWYVNNRGEVCCLDTEGFRDGQNDGPYTAEPKEGKFEADVIWQLDMMSELGVSQHNMCSCSVTCAGDVLLVITSNGVDFDHRYVPAPDAPAFMGVDRNTGEVLWTDASPGTNILHGQWSSPAYAVLGGQPQALFPGGDGWLYSLDPETGEHLWKFDCNPKKSKWILGGRGTRNAIISTPVIYDQKVYMPVGQDPEHGQGIGHMWCIDPTKRGDVSPQLAVDSEGNKIPHRRVQAVLPEEGEKAIPNPKSAALWHYHKWGESFTEEMHRAVGSVAIKNDLLFVADFSGLFHCVDAQTGEPLWTYDMFAAAWGSPLIADGKVYIGDEDGDVAIFELSREKNMLNELNMKNSVYSTPIVANDVLFLANNSTLFAITPEAD